MEKEEYSENELSEEIIKPNRSSLLVPVPQSEKKQHQKQERFLTDYTKYFNNLLNAVNEKEGKTRTKKSKQDLIQNLGVYFQSHSLPDNKILRKLCGWILAYSYAITDERAYVINKMIDLKNPYDKPTYQESIKFNNVLCRFSNLNEMFLARYNNTKMPETQRVYIAFVDKSANNLQDFFKYPYASKLVGQIFADKYENAIDELGLESPAASQQSESQDNEDTQEIERNPRQILYKRIKQKILNANDLILDRYKQDEDTVLEQQLLWQSDVEKEVTPFGNIDYADEKDLIRLGYIPHLTINSELNRAILTRLSDKFGFLCKKLYERADTYKNKYSDVTIEKKDGDDVIQLSPENEMFIDDEDFSLSTSYLKPTASNNNMRFEGNTTKDKATRIILPSNTRDDPPLWGHQPNWIKEGSAAAYIEEFESLPEGADEQFAQYMPEAKFFDNTTQAEVSTLIARSMIPLQLFADMSPSLNIYNNINDLDVWQSDENDLHDMSCLWSPSNGTPANGRMVYHINSNKELPNFLLNLENKDFPAEELSNSILAAPVPTKKPSKKGKEKVIIDLDEEELNTNAIGVKKIWEEILPNTVGVLYDSKTNTKVFLLDMFKHSPLISAVEMDIPKKDKDNDKLYKSVMEFIHEIVYGYVWHVDVYNKNIQSPFSMLNRLSPYKNMLLLQNRYCRRAIFTLIQEAAHVAAKEINIEMYSGLAQKKMQALRKNLVRTNIILFNIIEHDVKVLRSLTGANLKNEDVQENIFSWFRKLQKLRLITAANIWNDEKEYGNSIQNVLETIFGLYNIAAWAQHYMQKITKDKIDEFDPSLFSTTGKKRKRNLLEPVKHNQPHPQPTVPSQIIIVSDDDDELLMDLDAGDDDQSSINDQRSTDEESPLIKRRKHREAQFQFIDALFKKISGNPKKSGEEIDDNTTNTRPSRSKKRKLDDVSGSPELIEGENSSSSSSTGGLFTPISSTSPSSSKQIEIEGNPWDAFESYVAQTDVTIFSIQSLAVARAAIEQKWIVPANPIPGFGNIETDRKYQYNLVEITRSSAKQNNISLGSNISTIFDSHSRIITPRNVSRARDLEYETHASEISTGRVVIIKRKDKKEKQKLGFGEVEVDKIFETLSEFEVVVRKWLTHADVFIVNSKMSLNIYNTFRDMISTKLTSVLNTILQYKNTVKPQVFESEAYQKLFTNVSGPTKLPATNIQRPKKRAQRFTNIKRGSSDGGDNEDEEKMNVEGDNDGSSNKQYSDGFDKSRCFREFKPIQVRTLVNEVIGLQTVLLKIFTEVGLSSQYNYDPYIKIDDRDGSKLTQNDDSGNTELPIRRQNIMLHGPPGTGKTLVVTAFSNELSKVGVGTVLFGESATNLRGSYISETATNIECLFETAESAAKKAEEDAKLTSSLTQSSTIPKLFKSIVFLDEFEIIAKERTGSNGGGSTGGDGAKEESQAATNALLTALDGISKYPHVIFVAATNIASQIDTALRRRFTHMILVDMPTDISREIKLHTDIYRLTLPHQPGAADVNIRRWMTVYQDFIAAREEVQRNNLISNASVQWEAAVKHYTTTVSAILYMINAADMRYPISPISNFLFGKHLTSDYISNVIVPQLSRRTISLSAIFKYMDLTLTGASVQQSFNLPSTMTISNQTGSAGVSNQRQEPSTLIDNNWISNQQQQPQSQKSSRALDQIKHLRSNLRTDLELRLLELDGANSARYRLIKKYFDENKNNLQEQMKFNNKNVETLAIKNLSAQLNELDKQSLTPLGYTLSDVAKIINSAFQTTFNRALVLPAPISVLASWGVYGTELQEQFNNIQLITKKIELDSNWWIQFANDHNRGNVFKDHIAAYLRIASKQQWGGMKELLSDLSSDKDKMIINDDNNDVNTNKTLADLIRSSEKTTIWKTIILNEAFVFLPSNNMEWEQIRSAYVELYEPLFIDWNKLREISNSLFANLSYDQKRKLVLNQFVTESDFNLALKNIQPTSSLEIYAQAVQFNNDPETAIRDARSGIGAYNIDSNNK